MKDTYLAWLIIFGIVWGTVVLVGYVSGLKKALIRPQVESSEPTRLRKGQKEIAEETELKRKQSMESLQQKVRDNRKDY